MSHNHCDKCGATLMPERHYARYCSVDCKREANRQPKAPPFDLEELVIISTLITSRKVELLEMNRIRPLYEYERIERAKLEDLGDKVQLMGARLDQPALRVVKNDEAHPPH